MRIETERLILRRPRLEDVDVFLVLVSDPSFASAVPEIPHTKEAVREYLETESSVHAAAPDMCFNLLIERRHDGQVLGLVTLVLREHHQGQVGYALHSDHRGFGYATEAARAFMDHAFRELGLHRISADTRVDNVASWRVMERLGMTREARFREAELFDGSWRDVVVHAVLADEWIRAEQDDAAIGGSGQ